MAVEHTEQVQEIQISYKDPVTGEEKTEIIPVHIIHSNRKTLGIVVDENARVTLRLPNRVSAKKGMEYAKQKDAWILSKVHMQRERMKEREKEQAQREKYLTKEQEAALKKRYVKAARVYFKQRCDYYAKELNVTYRKIRIAEQKTVWGSCSSSGTLSFHWKLMLAPIRVQEYVIVHEMCHLVEMNHSKAFWSLVESQMPDYKEQRKWLKENGHMLRLSC